MLTGDLEEVNAVYAAAVLDKIHAKVKITELLIPGSRGIAEAAILWGMRNNVKRKNFYLVDDKFPVRIRTKTMLESKPDLVIGFPGGRESTYVLAQAQDAGIRVLLIPEEKELI